MGIHHLPLAGLLISMQGKLNLFQNSAVAEVKIDGPTLVEKSVFEMFVLPFSS